MTPEAPMRANRRGIRRWFWIIPIALPVLALLLGNGWLASPPGRHWIAGKIQRRAGLDARVGHTTVWPWNGVTLHHVELLQPPALRSVVKEPLASIRTLRLVPIWKSWLQGGRDLRAIELDSPRIVAPIELLSELAKTKAPPAVAGPPVIAAAPPQTTPPPFVGPPAPAPTQPVPPTTVTIPPAPTITLSPTGWLRLKNASFTLISAASGKPWIEISGVTGAIPIAGSPAQSHLTVGSIRAAGQDIVTGLNAPLDWQSPLLSLKPIETEIHNFKLTLAGKLAMLSGLPLQLEAQLPSQPLASVPLPGDNRAAAESIAATARFRGLLLAPGTWQADLIAEALAPSLHLAGHDATFDRGSSVTVLRGGVISCVDARLIGDDLSVLGNATVLADGRAAAALRLVAPPETATAIAGRLFPNNPSPPSLTPLSTPQRAAFDLEAFGTIRQLFLRLGRDGPIVEIKH